jgi:hypothetical protein
VDTLFGIPLQHSIKLLWNHSSSNDVYGYNVYRKEVDDWILLTEDPIPTTSYEDYPPTLGERYTYMVSVIDSSFNESNNTPQIDIMTNPPILQGWPTYIGAGGRKYYSVKWVYDHSSPAFGDIDGDGKEEIVVGSNDKFIYVYNDDGTRVYGWPKNTGSLVENSPAVCDLDHDGIDEIIIGGGNFDTISINIYHGDGSQFLPGKWPKKNLGEVFSSPIVTDIDNDGEYEIGIGFLFKVYFWNIDGSLVDGWPVDIVKPVCIASADIDNDDEKDIVIASGVGHVYAYNSSGIQKTGWPQSPGGQIYTGLALADIDEDGKVEIIVGTSSSKVYVYNSDGSSKNGWPVTVGNRVGGIPAIGEINGSPGLEIVVTTRRNQIYVYDNSGTLLFSKNEGSQADNYFLSPVLVDINQNGKQDIFFSTLRGELYAYDDTLTYLMGFPIYFSNGGYASPTIGDVNGDGNFDIIVKGSDEKLYVWDTKRACSQGQERWYRIRANNRNTCYYGEEEIMKSGFQIEKPQFNITRPSFYPPYPNPFYNEVIFKFNTGKRTKNVELKIYDLSGRIIKVYKANTPNSLLSTELTWDGRSSKNSEVSSGIYFAKLFIYSEKETQTFTKKIIKINEIDKNE